MKQTIYAAVAAAVLLLTCGSADAYATRTDASIFDKAATKSNKTTSKSDKTTSKFKVEHIKVSHVDSMLHLTFSVNPSRIKPGKDRQVIFTPMVCSREDSSQMVMLAPMTIAGRNRYYTHLREGNVKYGSSVYKAGSKGVVDYDQYVAWEPWMENSEVIIREQMQNCCRPVRPLTDTPVAHIGITDGERINLADDIDCIALTGDETVEMEARGSAYIDFKVNRTDILSDYRHNPVELAKIRKSIDVIKNDPDATITRLTIKGYASPEGPYENNVRLAMGRTEALKEYVRQMYSFDPEIMFTTYEPEDWEGLRDWLERSDLAGSGAILDIVNSGLAPDVKEAEIKTRFPKQYKVLLDSVYPGLRHSDYTVRYKIKTYVDIEELKVVYRNTPDRLRPVDFYRIAQTYPQGSAEYEEVLLKASEVYPHDPQASVNAANILLRRGDIEGASDKISYAGESGEAYYTRGLLALSTGDFDRASLLLGKAQEKGVEKARKHLDKIDDYKRHEKVTYMIPEQ